jgi:hypothetical protein
VITSVGRRSWWLLGVAVVLLVSVGIVSASFVLQSNSGHAGGVENGSVFLKNWQQTGALSSATPAPVPALVGLTASAPTRLPAAAASFGLDAGVNGHQALEWTFSESVGILVNQEIEVSFNVQYSIGATAHTTTVTAYLESQAATIGAPLSFNFYWDTGAATGITFTTESEISQACSAVGTCP